MEILSTGEKIKRARIYQGITLKELCGNRVSISKMSCIENGKIKADNEILKYISSKLDIDFDYLVRDVKDQILTNLNDIKNGLVSEKNIREVLKNNIEYCLEYSYNELSFEFTHMLFNFYIGQNNIDDIQTIISQYYDVYQKNNNRKNTIIFYKDMAAFFYSINEFNEAINYYIRLKGILKEEEVIDKNNLAYICFREGKTYYKLDMIDKAYETIKEAVEYVDYLESLKDKGDMFQTFASINIILNKKEAEEYIEKSYSYKSEDLTSLAIAMGQIGAAFFKVGNKDRGLQELKKGIEIFPKENKQEHVKFLNKCVNTLYENEIYEYAYEIADIALNNAIKIDNIVEIERAYYLKGMILQKQGNYLQAEMYMNLSLDSLFKFANNDEKYKRYLDMASMYHKLYETKEALKYFGLAMALDKEK